jgi:hypothetical protein
MAVGSYGYRDADAPVPVVAAMALTPYYVVVGLWWARHRSIEIGALVGAVTALVGYESFVLAAALYLAATESGVNSLTWLGFGVGFALLVALVGAFCGLIGGTLAHPAVIIPRSAADPARNPKTETGPGPAQGAPAAWLPSAQANSLSTEAAACGGVQAA